MAMQLARTTRGLRAPLKQAPAPHQRRQWRPLQTRTAAPLAATSERDSVSEELDVDSQLEQFMKRQAELESGAAFVRVNQPEGVLGADLVSDEVARQYCRDIIQVLKTLKDNRDMSVNEVKLVVSIEDPRAQERRGMGIEDERGVSRDEMSAALTEVIAGRVPRDRVALQCLRDELVDWPFLDVRSSDDAPAPAPAAADYAKLADGGGIAKPYVMGKAARAGDKPQTLEDLLPDWAGIAGLYGISLIPVFITVSVVLILFYNSLK